MASEGTAVNSVVNRQVVGVAPARSSVVNLPANQTGSASRSNSGDDQVRRSEPNREAVSQAVQNLNDRVQNVQRNLEFTIDELSGNTVISVIDSETEEVIRQIPPETVLNAAKNLQRLEGLLISAEA